MAQRVSVLLVDDFDGGEAVETVEFSIGPDRYLIDLSAENARALRAVFRPYIDAGRHPSRAGRRSRLSITSALLP